DFEMVECVKPGTSIEKYYKEPGFYRSFLPKPGMQECISKLAKEGHELYIATSSPVTGILDKIVCYEEHFPEFSWDRGNIIPITKKFLLSGDIMIDDKLENVMTSACTYKLLVDAPWNKNYEKDDNSYTRVHNAEEIY
ncbi:5' nucleotidase, NT5C type, partial [Bacillus subtilis]|uniref:5' nucleotidase, NT5C type n=1 Tax=Bacillus subtilis TaxID=1423 RepID=UPI003F7C57A5